jgi:hypothetical protein
VNGMGYPSDSDNEERDVDACMRIVRWAIIAVAIALGVVLALVLTSCAAAKPGAEAAYLAENLQCIDQAETRAEAVACRERVRAKWAVDGGAK